MLNVKRILSDLSLLHMKAWGMLDMYRYGVCFCRCNHMGSLHAVVVHLHQAGFVFQAQCKCLQVPGMSVLYFVLSLIWCQVDVPPRAIFLISYDQPGPFVSTSDKPKTSP